MGKVTKKPTDCGGDEKKINPRRAKGKIESSKQKTETENISSSDHTGVLKQHSSPSKKTIITQSVGKVGSSHLNTNKIDKKSTEKNMTKIKVDSENSGKLKSSSEEVETKKSSKNEEKQNGESSSTYQKNSNGNHNFKEEIENNIGQTSENGKDNYTEADELNLQFDTEENCLNQEDEIKIIESIVNESEKLESGKNEKMEQDSENLKPTSQETSSVNIVSTTIENPETVKSSASNENGSEAKDDKTQDTPNDDLLSYDSNITLKDVQIKLNDCLKDKTNDENTSEYLHKDISFGDTLRKLSGRRSISRMKNVTFRERQPSPNSSLFVNTSNLSLLAQDESLDYKILRHRSAAFDLSSNNGSMSSRKRKIESEVMSPNKKTRQESEQSFLNTSFEFLKGLRRPRQESTPCKLQPQKLNISGESRKDEVSQESEAEVKKWCVIM